MPSCHVRFRWNISLKFFQSFFLSIPEEVVSLYLCFLKVLRLRSSEVILESLLQSLSVLWWYVDCFLGGFLCVVSRWTKRQFSEMQSSM